MNNVNLDADSDIIVVTSLIKIGPVYIHNNYIATSGYLFFSKLVNI